MSLILALFCEIKSASADSSEDLCISQMTVGKALDNPYTKHKDMWEYKFTILTLVQDTQQ